MDSKEKITSDSADCKELYTECAKLSVGQPATCQVCTAANADGYCKDCCQFLCLNCFQIHIKFGANATHKLTSLEESEEMMDPQELRSLTGEAKPFRIPDSKPVSFNPYASIITPIRIIEGLAQPFGVAISNNSHVVVTEFDSNRVTVLDKEGKKIKSFSTRSKFSLFFSGGGQGAKFSCPRGIAITPGNFILVTDDHNIQKISMDGKLIASVGQLGTKPLEFNRPSGIAISPTTGQIYVADCHNHRIQVLNSDFKFGFTFGHRGSVKGQFEYPAFITIDNQGIVYVNDCGNHRIQKFTSDGKFLSTFGTEGSGPKLPVGITRAKNLLFVVEYANHRVSVFSTDGKFIRCFGSDGTNIDQFHHPRGITVDNGGRLYICDSYNNRLVVYNMVY